MRRANTALAADFDVAAYSRRAASRTTAARRVCEARTSKLICVFGCGGDRDRGKRPLMGRIATRLADRMLVTSDNPRDENPDAIIADIVRGATRACEIVPDRAQPIGRAIAGARAGDIVLLAGKGHEQHRSIRGVNHPFSDAAVAQAALQGRRP